MVRRIVQNSVSNVTVLFVKATLTFIMAPIIVRALGNYDYGIWEIIIGVIGYMGLLDLGLRPAITRYVSRYHAIEDEDKLRRIYSTSLLSMGVTGLMAFLCLALWALITPEMLAKQGEDSIKYAFLLIIIGTQVLITFPGYVLESMLEGFQKYTLKNNITLITTLIGVSVLYFLLQRGYGLLTLALVNTIGMSVKFSIYWIFLKSSMYGAFRFKIHDISWVSLKELLNFGSKNLVQSIASTITHRSSPIIIAVFLSPVSVTFYMIPANFILHIRNLLWSMTQSFMPLFSELDARGDQVKLSRLLTVASRYVIGIICPFLLGVWFLGVPFLARWMGPEYAENGRWVLYILTASYGLGMLNPFHNRFLTGIGRQGILSIIKSMMALIYLMLSLMLVKGLGKEGVALSVLIPVVMLEPVILYYTCKHAGITILKYAREVLGPLIIPNGLLILSLWFLSSASLLNSYTSIFGIALISFIIYIVAFSFLGIHADEQRFVLSKVKARIAKGSTLTR